MKRIWAPWRSAYVTATEEPEPGCVLCNRAKAPHEKHRELGILTVEEHAYVVQNRYPYTGGHLLVAPVRHVSTLLALEEPEYVALMLLLRKSIAKVEAAFAADGINVGMNLGRTAGAGIDRHCHFHIVPRWNGDTNFMSVLADVRVISQSLMETYDKLAPLFEE
jgi:ATP adenylyltransferase